MRRLTVKREKTFVGCAGRMKVYIEDSAGDTTLGEDIRCRRLGELKNGEEATYEIGEESATLFVIADKISADYCYDRVRIPAGSEDVTLSGKNSFNPILGNPFRFAGQEDGEKKPVNLKKIIAIMLCATVVGLLFGYGVTTGIFELIGMQEETFVTDRMEITLTKSFSEQAIYGYEAVFVSREVEIMVFRNSFTEMGGSKMTEDEYARAILVSQGVLNSAEVNAGGKTSYVFTRETAEGESYEYHLYAYKTEDAYWHIFFAVEEDLADKYAEDIADWAGSVVLK